MMLWLFVFCAFTSSLYAAKPTWVTRATKSFVKAPTYALISSLMALHPLEAKALPRPLPTEASFLVEKASSADKEFLKVNGWSTWNSADNPKYAVHNLKKKQYEINELCYIDRGKFEITPEGGNPTMVTAGDFVLFPKDFKCIWDVYEPVLKHWYEY